METGSTSQSQPVFPDGWPLETDWSSRLESAFAHESFQALSAFVERERCDHRVFPEPENVFTAFRLTAWAETRVVILGQDPYHGEAQAHGLSFSVPEGVRHPPSLRNIFRELADDLNEPAPESGDLSGWATQGVLLLNTVLTVREASANSHRRQGWEEFTGAVIKCLNEHPQQIVFVLWGKPAQKKSTLIDSRHELICSPHPSPLSAHRGFFGSRPFSRTNQFLESIGRGTIDWNAR